MRIGLIAGEASGDALGAALAAALSERLPQARLFGVGGARMRRAGVEILFAGDRLAVMGYWDAVCKLPNILRLRRDVQGAIAARKPRVLVGIDAPDFNLGVEARARRAGIKTAQLVCPSVWMWRRERLAKIRKAVDVVLCLFPFEPEICRRAGIEAEFVGHPAADDFAAEAIKNEAAAARAKLGLAPETRTLALLPGSRAAELRIHIPLFVAAARILVLQHPGLAIIAAPADDDAARMLRFEAEARSLRIRMTDAKTALWAADAAIVKSGTATLEAALAGRPMVVVYRQPRWAYFLARRRKYYLPYYSLPNILSGEFAVPELIQNAASPAEIAAAAMRQLVDENNRADLQKRFAALRDSLCQGGLARAADAIARLAEKKS